MTLKDIHGSAFRSYYCRLLCSLRYIITVNLKANKQIDHVPTEEDAVYNLFHFCRYYLNHQMQFEQSLPFETFVCLISLTLGSKRYSIELEIHSWKCHDRKVGRTVWAGKVDR